MQDAYAPALPVPGGRAAAPDDDWLSLPEAELGAMQAESLALFQRAAAGIPAARAGASLALLHQLAMARAIVRATGKPQAEAHAAMRSDHALGYLFGLASGSAGPNPGPRGERRVAGTLMMLHDLTYGRQAAEALTVALVAEGSAQVGEGFADGVLAAAADLAALERWRRGKGGALPGGLLDGLGWPCWWRDGTDGPPH
ncbi:MAG TPA: hypothetical protein VN329_12475 [Roseomonas sp.]|nr:hypothetical protein [Roseomonas sp.]